MAEYTGTGSTLDGYFKRRYGKLVNLNPKQFKIQRDIKFRNSKLVGDEYHEPIELTQEHGFTYAGPTEDAFDLAPSIVAETKNAKVAAHQIMLRSRFGVKAVSRSKSSKQAFGQVYDRKVKNMFLSARKRCEIDHIYGDSRIGVGEVQTVGTNTVILHDESWAAGVWAGMENAEVQFFTGNTHHNGDPTGGEGDQYTVTGINLSTRTLAFGSTAATDPNDAGADVAAGDQIWFGRYDTTNTKYLGQHGTSGTNSAIGLHYICAAGHDLTDGTQDLHDYSGITDLFNIDPSVYSLWASTKYGCGNAALSFSHVNQSSANLMAKGLDEDLCLYVSPKTWADLLDTETGSTIRRRDSGDMGKNRTLKVGAGEIEFFTQSGKITIKASTFVMDSVGYMIPAQQWERIGSTEPTFEVLGRKDHFFHDVADKAGFELRLYSDQAMFTEQPGKCCILYDIAP